MGRVQPEPSLRSPSAKVSARSTMTVQQAGSCAHIHTVPIGNPSGAAAGPCLAELGLS